jgi:hypothetical protein
MQAIILHNEKMNLHPKWCSMSIRAAYLLADSMRISPLDATLMQYERVAIDDVHFKTKINYLLSSFEKKEELKETFEVLRDGKITYDMVAKAKRKDKDDLVYMKRFEKLVDNIFLKDQLIKIENITDYGFTPLCPMLQDEALEMLDDTDNTAIHGGEFHNVAIEDLLQLKTPKITAPPLIFLQNAIFSKNEGDFPNTLYFPEDNIADSSRPWLHYQTHINLMGIQDLSFDLLQSLRTQLKTPREQLNKAMNVWINEAMTGNHDFDEVNFFEEQLVPAMQAIDKVIEDCIFLQPYAQRSSSYIMKIAGIPVKDLWDYYLSKSFISEEQRKNLQLKEQEKPFAGRWPTFALGIGVQDDAITEEINNNTATTKRKTINLDDSSL